MIIWSDEATLAHVWTVRYISVSGQWIPVYKATVCEPTPFSLRCLYHGWLLEQVLPSHILLPLTHHCSHGQHLELILPWGPPLALTSAPLLPALTTALMDSIWNSDWLTSLSRVTAFILRVRLVGARRSPPD